MPAAVANLPEMTHVRTRARQASAHCCDIRVALAERGLEEAVFDQLAGLLPGDSRSLAQVGEVDLALRRGESRPPAASILRGGRRELLADHAERQELVPLQPEDRLEPLDVLFAEQPVASARALRGEQALIFEVADLRDRDVGEIRLQPPADGADRVQARSGGGRRHRLEEDEPVLADLDFVAVVELCPFDSPPVQERSVQAAEVFDGEPLCSSRNDTRAGGRP